MTDWKKTETTFSVSLDLSQRVPVQLYFRHQTFLNCYLNNSLTFFETHLSSAVSKHYSTTVECHRENMCQQGRLQALRMQSVSENLVLCAVIAFSKKGMPQRISSILQPVPSKISQEEDTLPNASIRS